MLPKQSPERVLRAHEKLTPSFKFLAQYEQWLAGADDDYCDFALGNPQTMPLEGFVTALRDAATPLSPDWYSYKMTEPSSREIVQGSLLCPTRYLSLYPIMIKQSQLLLMRYLRATRMKSLSFSSKTL